MRRGPRSVCGCGKDWASGQPQVRDVVFSGKDWLTEYRDYYANPGWLQAALAQVRQRARGGNMLFDLYLSLENKTNPHQPFKDPRLIPVAE